MHRSSYGERDYAFGRRMQVLRTNIGLTQAGLSEQLGISRRAVGEWEAGSTYPKAEHLKALIALGMHTSAFTIGQEEQEIRTLWQAAHQKSRLDEFWLQRLLSKRSRAPENSVRVTHGDQESLRSRLWPRRDWAQAMVVSSFYGRQEELAQLSQWVVHERCQVVSVLGPGGIGKSVLAVKLMQQVAEQFQVVVFRSLRDAPPPEAWLSDCLQALAPEPLAEVPVRLGAQLRLLLDFLSKRRALLVLDNLESLLAEGETTGRMRAGCEGYARLLREVVLHQHQSCLLLTSREKPGELVALEISHTQVRTLRLSGLDAPASTQLLAEKDVTGTGPEQERLIEHYGGNPLALKIVSETIVELFGGEITTFLQQGEAVFGGVRELLAEQFARLSTLEQTVLRWLAILREPVSMDDLLSVLGVPLSRAQVFAALEGLRRRSLIEHGLQMGNFTLQSVVLEYATATLIAELADEIKDGRLVRLVEHGLELATGKDYVRQAQHRLLVVPLLAQLRRRFRARGELEGRLLSLLEGLRAWAYYAQGYGPANLLALLREKRGHLRDLDLSQLALRSVSLQGVELQGSNLSTSLLRECVFTETFDAIIAVATSPSGQFWATADRRGQIHLWREDGKLLHRVWRAHTDIVWALAFSPDEHLLASGSMDCSLKMWDVENGELLWSDWQTRAIERLAFSPDGSLLASGGHDATVRLWNPKLGVPLQTLPHPGPVFSLGWSPDGLLLASGDFAGTIRMWQIQPGGTTHVSKTLVGHNSWVRGLAFAPDGNILASASRDGCVMLWEVSSGYYLETLSRQTEQGQAYLVNRVVWSPDGGTLASSGRNHTIWLWDAYSRNSRAVLHGHSAEIRDLAFTPDSRSLLSGCDDGTLRLWDVQRGEAQRIIESYQAALYDLDWSPDGTELASSGTERIVNLWQVEGLGGGNLRCMLRGHTWSVYGVAWHPDGNVLASSGLDNTIRLWERATGRSLQVKRDPDHHDTLFWGVAWHPDGNVLASPTFRHGVLLWEVPTGSHRRVGRTNPGWVRRVAWSPDGKCLVGGGDDGLVYVWDASDDRLLHRLEGHHGVIMNVVWSPDGCKLASGGGSRGKGEIFVWDAQTGACLSSWYESSEVVYALAWSPDGTGLVSGSSDGLLRWWDLRRGECMQVRKAHEGTVWTLKLSPDGQRLASCGDDGAVRIWNRESGEPLGTLRRDRPYERLNITNIRGLTWAEIATLRALGAVEDGVL